MSGESVFAKVVAYNSIGNSVESAVGNGARIKLSLVPNAPILTVNQQFTTRTQISITWTDGAYDGGQPIIDYRLEFD